MTSPRNATSTRSNGRTYTWPPTGETFPSVTTILNSLPKHALKNWAAKMVATFAVDNIGMLEMMDRDAAIDWLKREPLRTTQRAANLGSAIHTAIDTGRTPADIDEQVAPYLQQWAAFNNTHQPHYEHSEVTVYNRHVGYAGTADAIITSPRTGCRYVVDWKTGKGIYPEAGLQLAAYAHAQWLDIEDGVETPIPPISRGLIVHLQPDHYSIHQCDLTHQSPLWDTFKHLTHVHQWLSHNRDTLLQLGTTKQQKAR